MSDIEQGSYRIFSGVQSPTSVERYESLLRGELDGSLEALRGFAGIDPTFFESSAETAVMIRPIGQCIAKVVAISDLKASLAQPVPVPKDTADIDKFPKLSFERPIGVKGNRRVLSVDIRCEPSYPAVGFNLATLFPRGAKAQQTIVVLPAGNCEPASRNCFAVDFGTQGNNIHPTEFDEPEVQQDYIHLLQRCVGELLHYFPEPGAS